MKPLECSKKCADGCYRWREGLGSKCRQFCVMHWREEMQKINEKLPRTPLNDAQTVGSLPPTSNGKLTAGKDRQFSCTPQVESSNGN